MLDFSFTDFNLLEGMFWVICAIVSFLTRHRIGSLPYAFWHILSLDFFLFGISDFVEAYYPLSFLEHGGEWLFIWKLLCIIGFIGCFIWYLIIRIREK